ncbi:killer cell immunoglobulin-like receptor 2DL3 [Elgaria multicarinata webbii]|uniref:killer cell immunoglobulin-like receptor 2DL3 n=1 Tax=Elgaria multicarinata webbii TaxID=159646 RepID=UPI002FCCFF03
MSSENLSALGLNPRFLTTFSSLVGAAHERVVGSAGWWLCGQWHISRGRSYPKPSISVSPSKEVSLGGNATIQCKSEKHTRAEFYLLKEGASSVLAQKTAQHDRVEFPIANAKLSDGGIYWCEYNFLSSPNEWSFQSDPVCIKITDKSKPTGQTTVIWASGATGLLLLFLLLLLLAFLWHRKRRKGSPAKERNQPVDQPLETDIGADPNEVSYAVLNHLPLKSNCAAVPDGVPETCVYASVAKERARNGQ